jgi:hypothetical protein
MPERVQDLQGSNATAPTAEDRAAQAKQRLEILMPFDEWCARLHPTPAAMELYQVVHATLQRHATGGATSLRRHPRGTTTTGS